VWDAVEHKGAGRLLEPYTLIKTFGILLCLNVYQSRTEMLSGCINGMKLQKLELYSITDLSA
jgi:hypothetical protein